MNKKILLLEDDRALSMGIVYMLKEDGFTVTPTFSLAEGKQAFSKHSYDLLILDIMLPDGTGYDFCSYVRETSDIPIIFLTALDEEVNVVMGLDLGADDYMSKPFRSKELLARIRSILRRKSNNVKINSSIIKHDSDKLRYSVNGVVLDLTAREYRLLHMLILKNGSILTREALISRIWDADSSYVDDNTLSVYIKRLRDKLNECADTGDCIRTVRGIGYRWEE